MFSQRRISRILAALLVLTLIQSISGLQAPSADAAAGSVGQPTVSGTCASTVGETSYVSANFINSAFCLIQFTSGTTWTVPTGVTTIDLLVVGGGGGGGSDGGGGGGGGEVRLTSGLSVTSGQVATVTIGSGGAGAFYSGAGAISGGTSSFAINSSTYTANGGGASVNWQTPAYFAAGGSGGSGGSQLTGGTDFSKGGRNSVQNDGYAAGGYGTAGSAGVSTSFTGPTIYFGGGGGGGICTNTKSEASFGGLAGGAGGGGRGAYHTQNVGSDTGQPGIDGYGGGGGGGSACNDGGVNGSNARTSGGRGGNGTIYIRFAPVPALTLNPVSATNVVGDTATFSAAAQSAVSGDTRTKKWQVLVPGGSWADISGATSDTYSASAITRSMHGNQYRYVVTDSYGTAVSTTYSTAATLSVISPLQGETDSALSFTGSTQYAEVADTAGSAFDTTGTFTIEAWVKPSNACPSAGAVIAKLSYMVYCNFGVWYFMALANGTNGSGVSSSVPVVANEWHHLAFTKTSASGNVLFYYDGLLVQTIATGATAMTPNDHAFQIGRWDNNASYWFQGQIDEVRMYSTQRTASDVLGDMKSSANINDANLSVYYDFNEGSGSTIYNRKYGAAAGTDLTTTGSPTFTDVKIVDTSTLAAYTIVKFPRSYINAYGGWRVPTGVSKVTAVVVAGGGGGGARAGGGGGAGGYLFSGTTTLTAGNFETITVGQGGSGARLTTSIRLNQGQDGQDSKFGNRFSTLGGGGGGGAGGSDNSERAGRDGGSGGGASGDFSIFNSSAAYGVTRQVSTYAMGQGNNGGSGRDGDYWPGGGGGGASTVGGTSVSTTSKAGNGGNGFLDPVGGSGLCLASGGGGGTSNAASGVGAGDAGTCSGGTTTATAGTVSSVIPSSATANTGSGGGGSGWSGGSDVAGGSGGSGVIVIRWITATKPLFAQPTNDTTTAGLSDTMTVSANPITPLTRNYQWQVSTDTGTTWVNAVTGSGQNTYIYTTPTLETNSSGLRYQYRVIVIDSDTAGLFIVDTSTAIYLIINPRITYTGSYTVQKYGTTHQDTFTVSNGTGNKSFTYSPNNRAGITWTSPTTNSAVLTISTTLSPGTYLETVTATDSKGAQTSIALSILINKADTITVTAAAKSDTYTGSTLTFTPTFTVVGLKNSDTVTPLTWSYSGADNAGTIYSSSSTKPMNAGIYAMTPVPQSSLTDSYTAVVVETATLTIYRATRTISLTGPGTSIKYGETKTVSSSVSLGLGDGTVSYTSSVPESCTVSSTTIQAIKSAGTCLFTAAISRGNNFESATSTTNSATLTKADTLTVTVNAITPVTYTGSAANIAPTVTVSGLKYTNSVGVNPVTIRYSSSSASGGTCASGGACAIGDTGPGGGTVFYDAGSQQSWGRYLEIAKSGWNGAGETTARWCSTALAATAVNVITDGIGQGLANSTTIANACGEGAAYIARNYNGGGKTNWYLPTPAEFGLMYANRGVIDLSTSLLIWLSTEPNDANRNWVGVVGALSSAGTGGNNKLDVLTLRPIRAFAAGDTASNFSTIIPTDADTYTVQASSLSLSSGSLSDYQGVTYVDGTLRINRAQQSQLYIAQFAAIFGTPYKILVSGGSGIGAITETFTAGTATGCALSGDTLTSTSVGTCNVIATKARDKNYETATAVAYIYFLSYILNQPAQSGSGSGMGLTGATSVTLDPNQAPTISGISISSGQVGDSLTITGAGFTASALQSVKFWRNILASIQGTPTNTQIVVLVPTGATTGKIIVTTLNGQAITEGSFTVLP